MVGFAKYGLAEIDFEEGSSPHVAAVLEQRQNFGTVVHRER